MWKEEQKKNKMKQKQKQKKGILGESLIVSNSAAHIF